MSRRLVSVTAHTTLDHVDARVRGYNFEHESVAVANATADREDPVFGAVGFAPDARCGRPRVHRPGSPGEEETESRPRPPWLLVDTGSVGFGCHTRVDS